jgi:hypothetical protein
MLRYGCLDRWQSSWLVSLKRYTCAPVRDLAKQGAKVREKRERFLQPFETPQLTAKSSVP